MADNPMYRAVLGYHRAGEFFYFSMFGGGDRIHADEQQYHDLPSFAGLVTAIHEHHHLIQDLSQGYFWWRQTSRDLFAYLVADTLRKQSGAPLHFPVWRKPGKMPREFDASTVGGWGPAISKAIELDAVDTVYLNSSTKTEELLRNEIRDSPELSGIFGDDLFQLTTIDLIECQAAILTELCISKRLVEESHRFDLKLSPICKICSEWTECCPCI